MRYGSRFINEEDQVVKVEELNSSDDREAHFDARSLMAKTERFSGYELWRDGRKVDEFKLASAPDPRTSEVEAKLCGLAPADESLSLSFPRPSPHCRRDLRPRPS